MRRRQTGLSLVEVLITLFLVALILGLIGTLLSEYFHILRFSAAKNRTWLAAQVGVQRAVGEAREAVAVINPPAGGSASELRFRKIDPVDPNWLPTPKPSPLPATWDPYAPASLLEVCYYADGRQMLVREVGPAGAGPSAIQSVCEGISGFSCDFQNDGSILITMSVQEEKLTRTLVSRALPLVP